MSRFVRRRSRCAEETLRITRVLRSRLVRRLRVEALEERRLLAVSGDPYGPALGGEGSGGWGENGFQADIWISEPGKQPWPVGSDYTRRADSALIENPLQVVEFDPITRTEYIAPWDPINTLDGELATLAQSAGFSGVEPMLASLKLPNGLMDDGNFKINDDWRLPVDGNDSGIGKRTVHGNDDRVRVNDTLVYPWRAHGRLQITFANGASGHCSGAMIGTYHFLTAGHCVHSQANGGWATGLRVSLAQDLNNRFYGEANWTHVRSYTGWTQDVSPDHDWALITLDRNVGSFAGWLGYEWRANDAEYNGMNVNTAGYPGDLEAGRAMYRASGPTTNATANRVFYSGHNGMDTAGGQSGSAVWRFDSTANDRFINVVHAYGGTSQNSGTRINETKFNSLQTWRTTDNTERPPVDRPDLIDYDRWYQTDFAFFSPATASTGDSFSVTSYPRNNGTANAGQFTVRYRLSTNNVYDANDYLLGDTVVSSLTSFNWATATLNTTIPDQVPAGQYFVVWSIDATGSVNEFIETNNTGTTSTRVTVQASSNDVGDTLGAAAATNVGPISGSYTRTSLIGDGDHGDRDVDIYTFQANAGSSVVLTTSLPTGGTSMDTMLRLFDANGTSLAINDDAEGLYSRIEYTFDAGGQYYIAVSGYPNSNYSPWTAGSGDPGSTGDYRLDIELAGAPGEIRGFKWHDVNSNQVWDDGEPALPGWTIYLDLNGNGELDNQEPSQVTDNDGSYAFVGLAPGSYTVGEVMQEGWTQIYPGEGGAERLGSASPYSPLDRILSTASDLTRYDEKTLATTGQWVVRLADAFLATDVATHKLAASIGASVVSVAKYLENSQIWEFSEQALRASAVQSLRSLAAIESFYPLVTREHQKRSAPNDPLFGNQWHLQNTGQTGGTVGEDANVVPVWDNVRGTGVTIAIVDDGLQHTHPDLSTNYRPGLSWDFNGNDADPMPTSSFDGHGTSAAGVAAATGNNSAGVSGAAPNANVSGIRLIAAGVSDATEADALTFAYQGNHIYSNSWGPFDSGDIKEGPGPLTAAALIDGVTNGRDGLGSIYVWAAGNGLGSFDNVNYDGYANSRYTIAVSAIDHDGRQSSYSEPGAPILVAAYSSGDGIGITTTDLLGSGGYDNGDYTSDFGGTSSATPLVSGVIALMLEANPNLTWRDVQHILVETASQNDSADSDWVLNGAGHLVNHKYGFGAIDALAAVNMAQSWVTVAPETTFASGTLAVNGAIPDNNSTGISADFTIDQAIEIESVEIVFDATHTYRGDLRIVLTSPSGTQSVLAELHNDSGNDYNNWVFTSMRHWGESSLGEWTLTVSDGFTGDTGTWSDWEIIVHGTAIARQGVHVVSVSAGEVLENVNFGNKQDGNQPPFAVRLDPILVELNENTLLPDRLKVADIFVDDDGLGENELSLSGPAESSFEIDGQELFLRAGTMLDHEILASLQISISVDDLSVGNSPDASVGYTLIVLDLAEISNVLVGDETGQRSRVDQVVITFDGEVEIAEGAFQVSRRPTASDPGAVVGSAFSTQIVNGVTVATITFSGASTRGGGALIDGNYELMIDASKISRGGNLLDGDRDGTGGGDFLYGDTAADAFFALYGDLNGDRQVGLGEFNAFRAAFGRNSGQSGYSRQLDFDDDGVVNLTDFNQFRGRFGRLLMFE